MEKFVPYEKLSKKKKRELDLKRRVTWERSPVTRRAPNPKAYTRKKRVRDDYDDPGRVFSYPALAFSARRGYTGSSVNERRRGVCPKRY